MPNKQKEAGSAFERKIAEDLCKDLGIAVRRMPLSGTNSGHGPGDLLFPKEFDVMAEAKMRTGMGFHSWLFHAQDQAGEYGIKSAILFTKSKGDRGYVVSLDAALFRRILAAGGIDALRRT